MPSTVLQQILNDSRDSLNVIVASDQADDIDQVILLAHQCCYTNQTCTFPYFANRQFQLNSPFAKFWIRRWARRGLIGFDPLRLTTHGRSMTPNVSLQLAPSPSTPETITPYSRIPPSTLSFGTAVSRIKPQIGDMPLTMITLLPPDPTFYLIFSHFDTDGMRTVYPILKEGTTYISLFMGDIRNIISVPNPSLVERCYQSFRSYLERYLADFERHLRIVLYLLLSISRIRFVHLCHSGQRLLNKLTDEIQQITDFTPTCNDCNMDSGTHTNLVNLRHSLGRSWEKGVLSELFFSKLLTDISSRLDSAIEVYPRIVVEGLPHECDIFVRRNDRVLLFELKRSTDYDGWCQEGVRQLTENKAVLERYGMDCYSILVTNMTRRELPSDANIDMHLIPRDIFNLGTIFENLVS